MTSHYTYMWQRPTLPEKGIAWKTSSQMLKSAVPSWSRPIENGETNMNRGAFGKARPLKHWRKQLDPRYGSGQGRSGVGMPMDIPGGKVSLADTYTYTTSLVVNDVHNNNLPSQILGVYCKISNSELPKVILDYIKNTGIIGPKGKIFEDTYKNNNNSVYIVSYYTGGKSNSNENPPPYYILFIGIDGNTIVFHRNHDYSFHNITELENWLHNDGQYTGKIVTKSEKSCIDVNSKCHCENAKKTQDYIMPDNRYKNQEEDNKVLSRFKFLNPETNYKSVSCVACSPQANVIKSATTLLSKKYYTDSRAYLRARNKRYKQNLSGTTLSNIKYKDPVTEKLLWPSDEQDGVKWRGPQIRAGSNCVSPCCINKEPGVAIVNKKHQIVQTGNLPGDILGDYDKQENNNIPQGIYEMIKKLVYSYLFSPNIVYGGGVPELSIPPSNNIWDVYHESQIQNLLNKIQATEVYINKNNTNAYMLKLDISPVLAVANVDGPGCIGIVTTTDSDILQNAPFGTVKEGSIIIEGGIIEAFEIVQGFFINRISPISCNIEIEKFSWGGVQFSIDPNGVDMSLFPPINPEWSHTSYGIAVVAIESLSNTSTDAVRCPSKMIYKPNNRKFSVQGAVDSSSRIQRLKLNTITKSANSLGGRHGKGPFGMEGVNASRYTGRSEAPYFLKSKNQVCRPYHVHQDHTLCFFTPTGSIGNRFPIIPKEAGTPLYIENLSD